MTSDPTPDEALDDEEEELNPPSPQRVARRALALAAVSGRALLEQVDPADPQVGKTGQRILDWVNAIDLGGELEPDEWDLLRRPLGTSDQQTLVNAVWRIEGLGVLAWALSLCDLRPHDELVVPDELLPAVGMLDREKSRALLDSPTLRGAAELEAARERLFAVHWRVRELQLGRAAMNFAEFARTAWFGPLSIEGIRLIDNDLAVGDQPIASADPDLASACASAAMERHLAINWLNGDSEVYSETDVST